MKRSNYDTIIGIAETERLRLLSDLIKKRTVLTDMNLHQIEEMIVYCDNKVMQIGNKYTLKIDPHRRQQALSWQLQIMDLEKQKMLEKKELFRDISFLQNEWIKGASELKEKNSLDELLK